MIKPAFAAAGVAGEVVVNLGAVVGALVEEDVLRDEPAGLVIAIALAGLALIGVSFAFYGASISRKREEDAAGKVVREKESEIKRKEFMAARDVEKMKIHEADQRKIMGELSTCVTRSESELQRISSLAKTVSLELDQAEREFTDGAFAPFWDAVEKAANHLAESDTAIDALSGTLSDVAETSRMNAEELIASVQQLHETMESDAAAAREHEEKQREMLDNMQRKRKPRSVFPETFD